MPDADPVHAPPRPRPDPDQAAELDETGSHAPMHASDQAPNFLLRTQAWFFGWFSSDSRVLLGITIVFLAVVVLLILSSFKILRIVFEGLDVLVLFALFLINWLGNGGALVPIPGVRFIGLLLVFQQSVILPSWEVFGVAGAAMALGLFSYYIAGARTAQSYAAGDTAGAEQLAQDSGMLDEEALDFAPGAELDARAVDALAGVGGAGTGDAEPAGSGSRRDRLRRRFTTSLKKAQERARPVIEQRGVTGMLLLCFAPTPMGTAAAYVGGLMGFGFARYVAASFAAKYLLVGIIVLLGLIFSDAARAVDIPEVHVPIIDITLFEGGPSDLPTESMPPA